MLLFTKNELLDLISAIDEAKNELCVGKGFPEANAYFDRLSLLKQRLDREVSGIKEDTHAR